MNGQTSGKTTKDYCTRFWCHDVYYKRGERPDKRKYLRYLIEEPRFAAVAARHGGITPDDFHLPRLRYSYNTPYTDEIVEDTYHWMVRWGLLDGAACSTDLVDNRLAEPEAVAVAADD